MIKTKRVSTGIKCNGISSMYLSTKYWTITRYVVLYMMAGQCTGPVG